MAAFGARTGEFIDVPGGLPRPVSRTDITQIALAALTEAGFVLATLRRSSCSSRAPGLLRGRA
jgi:hypothetical protein